MHGLELLAPAGKWSVLEAVVNAGADAVYCGGKRFNMRMLKPGYNFSDQELQDAVAYLHQQKKHLYITVNNLYHDDEIHELKDYLSFLEMIGVDAIIVQDLALVALGKELRLTVPFHASVQMGIGSLEACRVLERNGFTRAILSKNLSLDEITAIAGETRLMIEFFAHGDLCISHTGQCYMSSFIGGASGNRGMCLKPCRWTYRATGTTREDQELQYELAHNDLCTYPYLKELTAAGVKSFKIEGRMREPEYLSRIIRIYREALDRIEAGQAAKAVNQDHFQQLWEHRVRDFTSGNLLARPARQDMGRDGRREPFFPTEPRRLARLSIDDYPAAKSPAVETSLRVKARSLDHMQLAGEAGIKDIILEMKGLRQAGSPWNQAGLEQAFSLARQMGLRLYIETPRIVTQEDMPGVQKHLAAIGEYPWQAALVNELGSWRAAQEQGLSVEAGWGFNIINSKSAGWLLEEGMQSVTASLEADLATIKRLGILGARLEVMVQGPLCGIITDYCLARAWHQDQSEECPVLCLQSNYGLVDHYQQTYRIRTDGGCRNYIYYPYDLCRLANLSDLAAAGVVRFRIEGQFYDNNRFDQVINIYAQAVKQLAQGKILPHETFAHLLAIFPEGLTAGPAATAQ